MISEPTPVSPPSEEPDQAPGDQLRRRPRSRRTRSRRVAAAGLAVTLVAGVAAAAIAADPLHGFGTARVGTANARGILLPTSQRIKPIGTRTLIKNGRLLSSTISPDGRFLAAYTWYNFVGFLTVFDLQTGTVVQQVGTGATGDPVIGDGTLSPDGPKYSRDGKSLWVSQSNFLQHFQVAADGTISNPVAIRMNTTILDENDLSNPTVKPDLPSGMALSRDGRRLYVALNGTNKLALVDTATNKVVREVRVGIAPRQVVIIGDHAFVTNQGGRRARQGEYTNQSYGSAVVANRSTGGARTGSVTRVDLVGLRTKQIRVGLQPTAAYSHAGTLMVANTAGDSVSLINPTTARVVQTVNVNPLPGTKTGSHPNAITMPDPHHVLVSLGRDNALAVYGYRGPRRPLSYQGLLPTDFYPVNVTWNGAAHRIVVTNDKGIGSRGPQTPIDEGAGTAPGASSVTSYNTYDDTGSLTQFRMPSHALLARYTHQVFVNNDWDHLLSTKRIGNGPKRRPVAIPVRLGDPSKIKHVFLIVRENRTYDQVLGDIGRGNSDPALAQFGRTVTPNAHALVDRYPLLDNFYDPGTLSADGHNWIVQADATDYIEREFGAFYRSYPAQGGDALAYQRDGFLWNAAQAAGKTVRVFGEFSNFMTLPTPQPTWSEWYKTSQILEGKATGTRPVDPSRVYSYSDIPSLNRISDHRFPLFDLDVPDQYRADIWLQSFRRAKHTGKLANLQMIWMPDDHTSGVDSGKPSPVAAVADNDLAVGRIIAAISHSKFWKSSAVFVVEDDAQNGTDHVDGHRAPLIVASPYARRGVKVSTYYTQVSMVKTIEQILGVAPMNQLDRAALPMRNVFTDVADTRPYTWQPNQIPLTTGVTTTARTPDLRLRRNARVAGVPASQTDVYQQWVDWSRGQHFSGAHAIVDWANPQQMNRLTWYTTHGWTTPYPGDSKVLAPYEVPGRYLPPGASGD